MGRLKDTLTAGSTAGARRARIALKAFAYSGFGRDRWQLPDRVVAELGLKPGDLVADLGAGGGYFTFHLARAVRPSGIVYAVDTDPDMRSAVAARAAGDRSVHVVPVEAAPDDPALPQPVDLALLVNAFHHLPERRAYLAKLAGLLRPGGRVAIVESRPEGLHRLIGHATAPASIRAELQAAGYTLVADHGFLPRQCFLVFERPARRDATMPDETPQETIRTLYRRFVDELWRDGAPVDELAGRLATPEFVIHQARVDGTASEARRGPEALAGLVGESLALFSGVSVTVDAGPVVEGDMVAARWTFHGTYKGGIPGATAPAGTKVEFSGIDLFRVEDGRFAEYWVSSDGVALMAQLGVGS